MARQTAVMLSRLHHEFLIIDGEEMTLIDHILSRPAKPFPLLFPPSPTQHLVLSPIFPTFLLIPFPCDIRSAD